MGRTPQRLAHNDALCDSRRICVLEDLEAGRKRPAMYLGGTGMQGLHDCVDEMVDNSVGDAMAGHCENILAIIHSDNSLTVEDEASEKR